eukprot:scaffold2191_cov118-Phaeocystis_antarctica.AAC.1
MIICARSCRPPVGTGGSGGHIVQLVGCAAQPAETIQRRQWLCITCGTTAHPNSAARLEACAWATLVAILCIRSALYAISARLPSKPIADGA